MTSPLFFTSRILILLAMLLGASMVETSLFAADRARLDSELAAIVAGRVEGSPPLSGLQVLVIRGGETAYEYVDGFARLTDQGEIPLNHDHKARIASISKLVATVGLMRLVETGTSGVFNATGPLARSLSIEEMLYGIKAATDTPSTFTDP